jgi:glycosyltransferase involved in cell wall biosynthesis
MNKKRVVIDARESGTSTGRYIDKLIEYLHRCSDLPEIIVLTRAERVDFIKEIAPSFKVLETHHKEFTFAEQSGFLLQLLKLNASLVHFGMTQQPVLYYKKSVTTMHDLTTIRFRNTNKNWFVFTIKQQVYKYVTKHVARKSARVIVPSNYVKQDIVSYTGIKPEKISVTYEAADVIAERPEPLIRLLDRQFIMYVGRPQPHKNLQRLVEAFASLHEQYPNLQLVLAGKKDVLYDQLEQYIKGHDWQNIVFTGFVSEGQLRWMYENCLAYVFPSLSEGFGLPGLEAMVHGAPVISSNATCLPEIYGKAAYYFDPENIEEMARAISNVIASKDLRTRMIAAGKKQASQYSWLTMAQQTLSIYDSF